MVRATAVYIRVSSRGQNEAGQRRELERWISGAVPPEGVRWYVDRHTGAKLDRPAFQRLQRDIFAGEVGAVVVWKLDRLSRSLRDGIDVLHDWLERGVRVVSVTQQFDLSGAVGKLLAAVLLGIAEMELELRRERQAAGIAAAKARGVYKGRPQGTTRAKPQRALELRQQGLRIAEIAQALGTSARTVKRYLKQCRQCAGGCGTSQVTVRYSEEESRVSTTRQ